MVLWYEVHDFYYLKRLILEFSFASFVCLKSENGENMIIIMMSIWNNETLKGEKSYLDPISLSNSIKGTDSWAAVKKSSPNGSVIALDFFKQGLQTFTYLKYVLSSEVNVS